MRAVPGCLWLAQSDKVEDSSPAVTLAETLLQNAARRRACVCVCQQQQQQHSRVWQQRYSMLAPVLQ